MYIADLNWAQVVKGTIAILSLCKVCISKYKVLTQPFNVWICFFTCHQVSVKFFEHWGLPHLTFLHILMCVFSSYNSKLHYNGSQSRLGVDPSPCLYLSSQDVRCFSLVWCITPPTLHNQHFVLLVCFLLGLMLNIYFWGGVKPS